MPAIRRFAVLAGKRIDDPRLENEPTVGKSHCPFKGRRTRGPGQSKPTRKTSFELDIGISVNPLAAAFIPDSLPSLSNHRWRAGVAFRADRGCFASPVRCISTVSDRFGTVGHRDVRRLDLLYCPRMYAVKNAANSPASPRFDLALVGCGRIAKKHLDAIESLDNSVRIVGAVDPDDQARRQASEVLDTPGYAKLDALLDDRSVDLVTLATPTGLHPDQAIRAAEAGAHVLTEKPLGTCLDSARSMVRRITDLNRRLFVVKQLRHHPLFLAVRDAVARGRFGQLHTIGLQIFWTRPQNYYDSADWRGTAELDGGALMNQASHYVDLLDWLFGSIAEVHAVGGTLARDIEVEDTAVVSLAWNDGFVGSLHVTMLTYPKNLATSLTVIGEQGTVRLGGPMCNQIRAWDFAEPDPVDETVDELAAAVPDALRQGHREVYRNVLASLRGDDAPVVDGREGLRSLAIIDAAYRALDDGTAVDVPPSLG